MLLTETGRRAKQDRPRTVPPQIKIELRGQIVPSDGEPPDCPVCEGYLELSQPGPDPTLLIGVCSHCERLCFVADLGGPMPFLMLVPTRDEIAGCSGTAVIARL